MKSTWRGGGQTGFTYYQSKGGLMRDTGPPVPISPPSSATLASQTLKSCHIFKNVLEITKNKGIKSVQK